VISFLADMIVRFTVIAKLYDRSNEIVFLSSNGCWSQSQEMYQKNMISMFPIYGTRCLHLNTPRAESLLAFHTIPNKYLFAL